MKKLLSTIGLSICFVIGGLNLVFSNDLKNEATPNEFTIYESNLDEWETLAEEGNLIAQFNLANMYREGKGVTQDYKTAVKWFTLAADQGNAVAQYNLGIMHSFGLGVVPNYKTAVKWYRLSAEQGNQMAQYNLGRLYYLGQGVPENFVYAYMWANQASLQGFDMGEELKGLLSELMTSSQIELAKKLEKKCFNKNFEGC